MKSRRSSILWCALFCAAGLVLGAAEIRAEPNAADPGGAEKAVVTDGHVYHDAGALWNHVSNWGLIGSQPSWTAPYSVAPSARWPGETGDDYLWAAGLWVGGVVLGERLVSTASFQSEFLATEAPADTIYPTARGEVGGNRYPFPLPDDDGDGLEDEEILNGLDDDADGLVDEDFAAIGDQHFVCGYNDFEQFTLDNLPDHTPLHVTVTQQTMQWSDPLADDFIGYDFTITNVGVVAVQDVYLGMFADFDIGPASGTAIAEDDYAGFVSTMAQASDDSWVSVQMAYMYDGAEVGALDGYAGWVLCGHPTDPAGILAPVEVGVRSFQRYSGMVAFENGGDPTNDDERYQVLSMDQWDSNVLPGRQSDYRTVISSGPFAGLAPGESITYRLALVLGAGLDDLIANAAEAVATCRGLAYDRDGDPANGNEFVVPWLRAEDAPVAAATGRMLARAIDGTVEVLVETNMAPETGLTVIRRQSAAVPERRWSGDDLIDAGVVGTARSFRLVDTDPVGWPRSYDLVLVEDGLELALDHSQVQTPAAIPLRLTASPNPFNPRVEIRYSVPVAATGSLRVFDLRGHLVRTLLAGELPAGQNSVFWNGDDESGRAVGSGVYPVRLETAGRIVEQRVTLVR